MDKKDLQELAERILALTTQERIELYVLLAEAKGVTPIRAADGDPLPKDPTHPGP
jgi:hypothetical protein